MGVVRGWTGGKTLKASDSRGGQHTRPRSVAIVLVAALLALPIVSLVGMAAASGQRPDSLANATGDVFLPQNGSENVGEVSTWSVQSESLLIAPSVSSLQVPLREISPLPLNFIGELYVLGGTYPIYNLFGSTSSTNLSSGAALFLTSCTTVSGSTCYFNVSSLNQNPPPGGSQVGPTGPSTGGASGPSSAIPSTIPTWIAVASALVLAIGCTAVTLALVRARPREPPAR